MKSTVSNIIILLLAILLSMPAKAQGDGKKLYIVGSATHNGETVPHIQLPTVYIFTPLKFRNKRERTNYDRLVHDVKKTLPLATEIRRIIIETYETLQLLPDEKAQKKHIDKLEKELKEVYTPKMKKLTLRQGKLLIKLVDRECNQSSYEIVKAFLGPFRAGFYQVFAWTFNASLKKEYAPENDDKLVERVVREVEAGVL